MPLDPPSRSSSAQVRHRSWPSWPTSFSYACASLIAVAAIGWAPADRVAAASDAPLPAAASGEVVPTGPATAELDAASTPEETPGTEFSGRLRDLSLDLGPPTLDRIRRYLEGADTERALAAADAYVAAHAAGRDADAARMVIGFVQRERGRHNLASEAFGRVRATGGPLSSLATYYEAEQDHLRGRDADAVRSCEGYRRRWPAGAHAVDCLRLIALAQAAAGNSNAARVAARAYDDEHTTATIGEQIELAIGRQLAQTRPADAVPILKAIAIQHAAPLSGRVAEEELARLARAGVAGAELPKDPDSRMVRAIALRDSGRLAEAWAEYDALRAVAPTNTAVAAWVEEEAERFGWSTRSWTFLAETYAARYQRTRDAEWTWKRYKVLARNGQYDEASTYALAMAAEHPVGHWKRSEEDVGRTLLLAKRYAEARAQFDAVAARGGWTGRRAEFEAAFAGFMAGELPDAVTRLSSLIERDPESALEARYWRAAAYRKLGQDDAALADEAFLVTTAPWSWYTSLVRARGTAGVEALPTARPYARDGTWAGQRPAVGQRPSVLELSLPNPIGDAGQLPVARPASPRVGAPIAAFAALTWEQVTSPPPYTPPRPQVDPIADTEIDPPPSYRPCTLFDPVAGRKALATFADTYANKWPELQVISDLASVGLYDLSGVMFSDWYDTWRVQVRKRDAVARRLSNLAPESWRDLFLATRDHHDTAKFLYGVWDTLPELQATEAYRLGYPLAHDRYVWTHAREHDLDPYLVLGLMRQESTYNASARSRVGARGAMQIMPRTGHLLADRTHDTKFDAGDLEDPTLAVGYGIRYLGLLMARFDGVYPLAVASYNGGPFNVSTWLSATGLDMPLDQFVEHIPYRETRDYVKKVSEGYAAYVALYGPNGAAVSLPPSPRADNREVVDF